MTTTQQQKLNGTIRTPRSHGRMFRLAPALLVVIVIITALAATVQQYHAAAVPGVTGITPWTQGSPELSPRPGVVGGFSTRPDSRNHGGGLFTFLVPLDASGPQQATLHLINAGQLASSYRYINLLVSATPAIEQDGRLVQDAEAFTNAAGPDGNAESIILNPENGSVTFTVEPTDGTIVDQALNTVSSPDFTGPHAYAFNVGVSGGSFLATGTADGASPTFILNVD